MIEHLEKGNHLYQKVFKTIPQIACLVDSQNLTVLETNDQFDKIICKNTPKASLLGQSCENLVNNNIKIEFRNALMSPNVYDAVQQYILDINTGPYSL